MRTGPSINVECDGCGDMLEIELPHFKIDHKEVVDGFLVNKKWVVSDEGDYCPDCSGTGEVCEECGETADYTEHCMNCSLRVCADCSKNHAERDCSLDMQEPEDDDRSEDDDGE